MEQTLSLRVAQPSDLPAVDRLLARSLPRLLAPDYPPSLMVMAVPRLARARPELLASGRYYLAEDAEGRLLGAGGWSLRRGFLGIGAAEVRQLATDPAAVRRGIGRALMARILEAAQAAGAHRIDCLATRTAVPFYAAQGFRRLGPVEVPLAPGIGFPVERMRRLL
jgi:GNAT superfamily N-acetyltransferase